MRGGRWLVPLVAFCAVFAGVNIVGDDADATSDSTAWSTELAPGTGLKVKVPASWKRYKSEETRGTGGKTVLFEGDVKTREHLDVSVTRFPARIVWSDTLDKFKSGSYSIWGAGDVVDAPAQTTVGSYPAYWFTVRMSEKDGTESVLGWMEVKTKENGGMITIIVSTKGSDPSVAEKVLASVKPG